MADSSSSAAARRPLAMSKTKHPPQDRAMTKLQHKKLLWIGEPARGPEAKFPDNELVDMDKIKRVLESCLEELFRTHTHTHTHNCSPAPTRTACGNPSSCAVNSDSVNDNPLSIEVEFFDEGAWNQVFLVTTSRGGNEGGETWGLDGSGLPNEFIFRVTTPVYPWYKTEAEVATIQFVRDHCTAIPAPKVYAYDSSDKNELGYEWILMEKLPGVPFYSVADRISLDARLDIARSVAEWVDQLSHHRFSSIGSFFFNDENQNENNDEDGNIEEDNALRSSKLRLGRPVTQQFMGDWRHDYQHARGPFSDLQSYIRSFADCLGAELSDRRQRLRAEIDLVDAKIRQIRLLINKPNSDDDGAAIARFESGYCQILDSATVTEPSVDFATSRYCLTLPEGGVSAPWNELSERQKRMARLTRLIDSAIPAKPLGPQATVLPHWNINETHVLVDPDTHRVTGLVDWAQLYTVPLTLLRSRYPAIMEREGDCCDYDKPPTSPGKTEHWERQKMREEFDRKLQELQSPWLEVGKDSKDEVPREQHHEEQDDVNDKNHEEGKDDDDEDAASEQRSEAGLCRRCYKAHHVTRETMIMEIIEQVQANSFYCEGILDELEELERNRLDG